MDGKSAPRCGRRGGRDGRRHPGQPHPARRFPARQPHDRQRDHRGRPRNRRAQAHLPVVVVRLSAPGAAADRRVHHAHRRARADQRVVCRRQDRGPEAVRCLPPAARARLHIHRAGDDLRARRQLRSRERACPALAAAPLPRGQGGARRIGDAVGQRQPGARVPLRRRLRRRRCLHHRKLRAGRAHQRRRSHHHQHPRAGDGDRPHRRIRGTDCL